MIELLLIIGATILISWLAISSVISIASWKLITNKKDSLDFFENDDKVIKLINFILKIDIFITPFIKFGFVIFIICILMMR